MLLAALAEILFEFIIQILLEVGVELFKIKLVDRDYENPVLSGAIYSGLGSILGALSILAFPAIIVQNYGLKAVNFIFSPILLGFALCLISWLVSRRAKGEKIFAIDKFIFGILFAAMFSLTRFVFTH